MKNTSFFKVFVKNSLQWEVNNVFLWEFCFLLVLQFPSDSIGKKKAAFSVADVFSAFVNANFSVV